MNNIGIGRANQHNSQEEILDMVAWMRHKMEPEAAIKKARWFCTVPTMRGREFWCAVATILSGVSEWKRAGYP